MSSPALGYQTDSSQQAYASQSQTSYRHQHWSEQDSMRSHMMAALSQLPGDSDEESNAPSGKSASDQNDKTSDLASANTPADVQQQQQPLLRITDLLGLSQRPANANASNTDSSAVAVADPPNNATTSLSDSQTSKAGRGSTEAPAAIALPGFAAFRKAMPKSAQKQPPTRSQDLSQFTPVNVAVDTPAPIQVTKKDGGSAVTSVPSIDSHKAQTAAAGASESSSNLESSAAPADNEAFDLRITPEASAHSAHKLQSVEAEASGAMSIGTVHGQGTASAVVGASSATHETSTDAGQNTLSSTLDAAGTYDDNIADEKAVDQTPGSAETAELDSQGGNSLSEPVRNVHMQLSGDNNQRVDVRLFDQAGELRVNVRAGDATLARALQDHIPDLTNRLDQQKFKTEVWTPRTANSDSSGSSNNHPSGQSADRDASQGRRQRDDRNDQRPGWWIDSDD